MMSSMLLLLFSSKSRCFFLARQLQALPQLRVQLQARPLRSAAFEFAVLALQVLVRSRKIIGASLYLPRISSSSGALFHQQVQPWPCQSFPAQLLGSYFFRAASLFEINVHDQKPS